MRWTAAIGKVALMLTKLRVHQRIINAALVFHRSRERSVHGLVDIEDVALNVLYGSIHIDCDDHLFVLLGH